MQLWGRASRPPLALGEPSGISGSSRAFLAQRFKKPWPQKSQKATKTNAPRRTKTKFPWPSLVLSDSVVNPLRHFLCAFSCFSRGSPNVFHHLTVTPSDSPVAVNWLQVISSSSIPRAVRAARVRLRLAGHEDFAAGCDRSRAFDEVDVLPNFGCEGIVRLETAWVDRDREHRLLEPWHARSRAAAAGQRRPAFRPSRPGQSLCDRPPAGSLPADRRRKPLGHSWVFPRRQ